jgi:uncharacterized membrane protein YgdD (TMEM256/DUF423 family)
MSNLFIGLGALSAFISVAAGAFGAHALKQVLDTDMLAVYHTAVDYQFFHSIGLIIIGALQKISPRNRLTMQPGSCWPGSSYSQAACMC